MSRFEVQPEIQEALDAGRPVVALETTLVTHGLPHPQGLETAHELEALVRAAGAVPATVGILDGAARVGLSPGQLERLATAREAAKVNLGNLAAVVAGGGPGSATVAATMALAARAGIPVFATGGIGGVHRDATESGDVSADLTALSRFPVAVVCAGAKAMLDLPRTVEMLETLGVPVLGYGTDQFPAFYRRESGVPVDRRCDSVEELAVAVRAHRELGLGTGVLIGNPIPAADELPRESYEAALAGALTEAAERGLRGREVTPFLLDRLRALTGGVTVQANLALLRNNALLAGELAVALERRASRIRPE